MLSRRTILLGGTAAGAALAVGAGYGVEQGVLPGRPWLQERLGLNGEDGVVPDIEAGPVEQGRFVSSARLGAETGWCLVHPPGRHQQLPVVVALHGLGQDHASLVAPEMGLPQFLAAAIAAGVPPFAVAAVDGGRSYWHPRPDGEDAGAAVTDELLPMLGERGLDTRRIGLLGWSMGGYGALRLGAQLGPGRVAAVVAVSPAIWTDPADASPAGFEDAAEYEAYSVLGHQHELAGIAVRIDCGTGDPFYPAVQDYAEGLPTGAEVTFEPGGHDEGYWRRVLPGQLAFLGAAVRSRT